MGAKGPKIGDPSLFTVVVALKLVYTLRAPSQVLGDVGKAVSLCAGFPSALPEGAGSPQEGVRGCLFALNSAAASREVAGLLKPRRETIKAIPPIAPR